VSKMSFQLAQALRSGRQREQTPPDRETILAGLLAKRAAAARAGLSGLERLLRSQILWALPIHRPPREGEDETRSPEDAADARGVRPE
jgi:hypothetical protein